MGVCVYVAVSTWCDIYKLHWHWLVFSSLPFRFILPLPSVGIVSRLCSELAFVTIELFRLCRAQVIRCCNWRLHKILYYARQWFGMCKFLLTSSKYMLQMSLFYSKILLSLVSLVSLVSIKWIFFVELLPFIWMTPRVSNTFKMNEQKQVATVAKFV